MSAHIPFPRRRALKAAIHPLIRNTIQSGKQEPSRYDTTNQGSGEAENWTDEEVIQEQQAYEHIVHEPPP